ALLRAPPDAGHAQVIVGTTNGNLILQAMIKGLRKEADASLQVRKDSISIFVSDELETRLKELVEIHHFLCRLGSARNRAGRMEVIAGCHRCGRQLLDHHSKRIEKREELLLLCLGQIEEAFRH